MRRIRDGHILCVPPVMSMGRKPDLCAAEMVRCIRELRCRPAPQRVGNAPHFEPIPEGIHVLLPLSQAVIAWGRTHPRTNARKSRVIDEFDMPVLKSTRNALGVLAGGGEADLVDNEESGEVKTFI